MKFSNNILLLLVALVIGSYVYWVEKPARLAESLMRRPLEGVTASELSSVRIKFEKNDFTILNSKPESSEEAGKSQTEHEHVDFSDWKLKGIEHAALEPSTVQSILNAALTIDLGEPLPSEDVDGNLGIYGLDTEAFSVELTQAKSENIKFIFGKKSEYSGKRYVKIDGGSAIYMVADTVTTPFNRKSDDFRDKTPINIKGTPSKVLLEGDNRSYTLSNADPSGKDGSIWKITEPFVASASRKEVDALINLVKSLKTDGFIDPGSKEIPDIKNNKFSLNMIDKDGKSLLNLNYLGGVVKSGDKEPNRFYFKIEGDPTIYWSKLNSEPTLFKAVDLFRETKFVNFNLEDVQSAEFISKSGSSIVVKRESDKWLVGDKQGDLFFVEGAIRAVSELQAVSFPEPTDKDFGFDAPTQKIIINLTTEPKQRVIVVGRETKPKSERYFVKVDKGDEPFIIDAAALKRISPSEEGLLPVKQG